MLLVVGIVIVPATPVGTGLRPGDVISVAPSGIPVGEPPDPVATPSGEVAPIIGVGVTVPSNCPSTCAMAALPTKSARRTAAAGQNFIATLCLKAAPVRGELIDDPVRGFPVSITAASRREALCRKTQRVVEGQVLRADPAGRACRSCTEQSLSQNHQRGFQAGPESRSSTTNRRS